MASTVWFSIEGVRYAAGSPQQLAAELPPGTSERLSSREAMLVANELDDRGDWTTMRALSEIANPGGAQGMSREAMILLVFGAVYRDGAQGSPRIAIRRLLCLDVSRTGHDVNLWIIGAKGDSVGGVTAAMATIGFQDYIRVDSIAEMVSEILKVLGPNDRILTLHITDHGYSYHSAAEVARSGSGHGIQYVGSDQIQSWGSYEQLERALAPLRQRMAPGAQIVLEGCTVGQADLLLAVMSRALGGVPVSGGTSYQQPLVPGMEGAIRTCMQTPSDLASTCWIDRDATALGRLNYRIQENVAIPAGDAIRSGFRRFKNWVVEVRGGLGG
jgi:hypothetical protein